MNVLFQGDKQDIVDHDGETMSFKSTPTDNSHISILTDILRDETPDISSHYKNLLLVHTTEVFLVREKKTASTSLCICATQTQIGWCELLGPVARLP